MTEILRTIFARWRQSRYVFLMSAIPMGLIGLWIPEQASGFYLVLALICLLQGAYPTMLGWVLVAAIYTCFSVLSVLGLLLAIFRELTDAENPNAFDPMNLIPFVAMVAVSLAVAIAVIRQRPVSSD